MTYNKNNKSTIQEILFILQDDNFNMCE